MSQHNESTAPCCGPGTFLPVLLLALALNIYLGWQFSQARQDVKQLGDQVKSNAAPVEQSKRAQSDLLQIATVLLQLAQSDPAAKAIVQKYGISAQGDASGTNAAPAPAVSTP